jgi:hypothetical protein
MESCLFLSHISTGDNFTVYPILCEISNKYDSIHIFTLWRNRKFIKQLYENFNNIIIHELEPGYNLCQPPKEIVLGIIKDLNLKNVMVSGFYDYLGYSKKTSLPFWREFYLNVNMDFDLLRNKYRNINRKLEKEKQLYDEIVKIYGKDYVFVHDHRHINYSHICPRANIILDTTNINLKIFHPNINYYSKDSEYYNLWDENLIRDNILDYGMIIENAKEIYITDSSFSCLCCYLDLSKVQRKVIFSPTHDYTDYDKEYTKGWEILK